MSIEAEKKLVAEWLEKEFKTIEELKSGEFGVAKTGWKPESERKWWDEIWEKMAGEQLDEYEFILSKLWETTSTGYTIKMFIHTAKPEICWKALIKTLEEEQ